MLGRAWLVFAMGVLLAVPGCKGKAPPSSPKIRYRGVTISVVVPDVPGLVAWLDDQRGEFSAQTGAQVELVRAETAEAASQNDSSSGSAARLHSPPGDVVIYPTSEMGSVVIGAVVVKLPKELLESSAFEVRDLAPAVLDQLIAWDRQPLALPISAEAMLVYYRTDLLNDADAGRRFEQKFGRVLAPPMTWADFDQIAEFFDGQDLDGDGTVDRSVAISSAGEALTCRAAAYGKSPQNLSFFFDVHTLEPLVAGPPFEQAMTDWCKVARGEPDPSLDALAAGRAVLGIGSSGLATRLLASADQAPASTAGGPTSPRLPIGCAALPGSTRAYQHDKKTWIDLPTNRPNRTAVVRGLVASVLDTCPNRDAAFDLLTFLTSRERSLVPVTTPANGLGPFRQSHLISPLPWTAAGWSNAGAPSFLSAMQSSLSETNAVSMLRILSADEFTHNLDTQAAAVFRGDSAAPDALRKVFDAWNATTERLGKDRIRFQYCYSVGMPVAM
jgi:multiple sugar transport system substrate-binding protein